MSIVLLKLCWSGMKYITSLRRPAGHQSVNERYHLVFWFFGIGILVKCESPLPLGSGQRIQGIINYHNINRSLMAL